MGEWEIGDWEIGNWRLENIRIKLYARMLYSENWDKFAPIINKHGKFRIVIIGII